ncbi:hypothetical protein [Wohlfahrtiimonas larvae]|uniref:TM2 domain-containing protein n=1 Tax=Wohlfahrtiimonas larvae TaxID=1157986 RepID=A0ABP9MVZ6_9GAMM|nr:hypothetical protein [Wohlfahrtiimonas larvae]
MKTLRDLKQEEESLRNEISQLTDDQRRNIYQYLDIHLKNPDTYAALNYFFICGLHHYYLKKWGRGTFNIIIMLLGIILIFTSISWLGCILIITIFIVEIPQLFQSQKIVYQYNNNCMRIALLQQQNM